MKIELKPRIKYGIKNVQHLKVPHFSLTCSINSSCTLKPFLKQRSNKHSRCCCTPPPFHPSSAAGFKVTIQQLTLTKTPSLGFSAGGNCVVNGLQGCFPCCWEKPSFLLRSSMMLLSVSKYQEDASDEHQKRNADTSSFSSWQSMPFYLHAACEELLSGYDLLRGKTLKYSCYLLCRLIRAW